MSWKVNKTKEVFKNNWLRVTNDDVETETGYKLSWAVIHKKPAVLVIPWDGEFTYIVGLYRHPVNYLSWEFVQGHFEHSSIKESAIHELEEEAGLKAKKFKEIGKFFIAPGYSTQEYYVFLATEIFSGVRSPEPDEVLMKVKKVKLEEIAKMIKNGKIKDGPTISAFTILNLYFKDSSFFTKKMIQ